MTLFDWFFPEPAQAMHLRPISRTLASGARSARRDSRSMKRTVDEFQEDLGFVALVLLSLLRKLIEKGVVTREELFARFRELDGLDGVKDGKLDLDVVRGSLGLAREEKPKEAPKPAARRRRRR